MTEMEAHDIHDSCLTKPMKHNEKHLANDYVLYYHADSSGFHMFSPTWTMNLWVISGQVG